MMYTVWNRCGPQLMLLALLSTLWGCSDTPSDSTAGDALATDTQTAEPNPADSQDVAGFNSQEGDSDEEPSAPAEPETEPTSEPEASLCDPPCTDEKICCDYGGGFTNCVLPANCDTEAGGCEVDTDCGVGLECCIADNGYSECVPVGTCPDNPGTEGGDPPAEPCQVGDCSGGEVCCATGNTTACMTTLECDQVQGVALCTSDNECTSGDVCCDLGSVQGCVPQENCGGNSGGGSGGGGGAGACSSDADCGAGEECCVLGGIGQGICLPAGTCPDTGGGAGMGECTSDADCMGGDICCDFFGFMSLCMAPDACLGGGSGGCESVWDCAPGEICCEGLLSVSCTAPDACFLGSELGPAVSCADTADCAADEECCDPYQSGDTVCAPAALCTVQPEPDVEPEPEPDASFEPDSDASGGEPDASAEPSDDADTDETNADAGADETTSCELDEDCSEGEQCCPVAPNQPGQCAVICP